MTSTRLELPCRVVLTAALLLGTSTAWSADEFIYTVQAGDHPWNLAQRYLKNPSYGQRLRELNRIPDVLRIPPGTRLRIPSEWLKLESISVKMLAVNGDTVVSPEGAAPHAGVAGEMLPVGAVVRTGPQASATLEFDDGSHVLVHKETELKLAESQRQLLLGTRLVALELRRGTLESNVTPATSPSGRFEIRSPSAIAAVRGTVFRVSATGQQTWTEVLDGSVLVGNAAGQSSTGAGFGTVVAVGQAPAAPLALPAPPDLSALPDTLERFPLSLAFPAVPGAVRYRTQLSPNDRFEVIVSDETAEQPRAWALNVADDRYVMRIRSVAANGLEGASAQRALVVHTRPEPPLLIEPAPGAAVVTEGLRFRWIEAGAGRNYRFQLRRAGDELTVAPLQEQTIAAASIANVLQDLDSGTYQWRIAAVDAASGKQGPWSDSQVFRRVLPGPGVEPTTLAPGSVVLRWTAQARTKSYHLQASRDATFAIVLVDTETPAAQFQLDRLTPGIYHIRVASTGEDGYVGPWGETQSLAVAEEPPAPAHWKALLFLLPLLLGI